MKNFLILSTLLMACLSGAQSLATDSTPAPGSVYEYKWTSDGSTLALLNAYTAHEVHIDLPFGLDFNAGHGIVFGTRTAGLLSANDVMGCAGYEVYFSKIVSDNYFVRLSAGGYMSIDHKPLIAAGIAFGRTFN